MKSAAQSLRSILPTALFFLLMLAMHWLGMERAVNIYDEGVLLAGAQRILQGDLPYRDFWTIYTPGQFYLIALLLQLFGHKLVVIKYLGITIKALIATLGFQMLREWLPDAGALLAGGLIGLVLLAAGFDAVALYPALLLALSAMYLLRLAEKEPVRMGWPFAAGVLTGMTALFRHDMGFYLALAAILYLLLMYPPHFRRQRLWMFLAGTALAFAPVALFFLLQVPPSVLYQDLIHFPATVYPQVRSLPAPGLSTPLRHPDWAVYFPFAVFMVLLALMLPSGRWLRRPDGQRLYLLAIVLSVLSLLFSAKGMVRVSAIHSIPAIVPAMLALPILAAIAAHSRRTRWLLLPLGLPVIFLLPLMVYGLAGLHLRANPAALQERWAGCSAEIPALGCLKLDADYHRAVVFLQQAMQPADCLYVGPGRHDKIFANGPVAYFLLRRPAITRWQETHPGLQNRADVQRSMLKELQQCDSVWLLLDGRWSDRIEPNLSARSSGVNILDNYLHDRARPIERFGAVEIFYLEP